MLDDQRDPFAARQVNAAAGADRRGEDVRHPVEPLQLVEARALGASAALLIARALHPRDLKALSQLARDLDLETLVEIRDERELDAALAAEATVIGVNNRNLETLLIDLATGERIVPLIPADRVAVFTARPGRIKHVMSVNEAHPRKPEFMTSDKLSNMRNELYELLHDEIRKTMFGVEGLPAQAPAPKVAAR